MIIKKYKAPTENEAIRLAKEDLGPDAIVMNVKTIKPRGILRLFKKSRVELTAAIDDNIVGKTSEIPKNDTFDKKTDEKNYQFGRVFEGGKDEYSEDAKNAIEEKINSIAKLLEQQMSTPRKDNPIDSIEDKVVVNNDSIVESEVKNASVSRGKVVDLIYYQLLENEVSEKYVDMIVGELSAQDDKLSIDNVLANTYQKIVLKLGQTETLSAGKDKPKIVFFVGNTGVGKTTTMAKLASKCKLVDKLKIAMFSVDTYRIAAIEQIKTYASILNAPMEVVYTPEDMKNYVDKYKEYDLILVDTAGRSHRNEDQKNDLQAIIDSVEDYEKEVYLVVSVTVKYGDLINIARTYDKLFDYKLIFTKLDETSGLGSILNLKLDTGKPLSYVTWGQNVPDDIGVLNPQIIAKKLLGGGE